MIRNVIEEAPLVQVRPHGEGVNLPRSDAGLYLESVKTQADVWALAHIDQATRTIFHLLSAGPELDPVPIISRSDFEECGLDIQFLFVDWPRTTDAVRIQPAFYFDKRPDMLAVVNVKVKHVPLVEIAVHER